MPEVPIPFEAGASFIGAVDTTVGFRVNGAAVSGKVLMGDGTNFVPADAPGTVTSVALTVPSEFSVSGSPITTAGTLALSWVSGSANRFLATPNGSTGVPSLRAIVAADIPVIDLGSLPDGVQIAIFAASTINFKDQAGTLTTIFTPTSGKSFLVDNVVLYCSSLTDPASTTVDPVISIGQSGDSPNAYEAVLGQNTINILSGGSPIFTAGQWRTLTKAGTGPWFNPLLNSGGAVKMKLVTPGVGMTACTMRVGVVGRYI